MDIRTLSCVEDSGQKWLEQISTGNAEIPDLVSMTLKQGLIEVAEQHTEPVASLCVRLFSPFVRRVGGARV
jgi:hypothetical protein